MKQDKLSTKISPNIGHRIATVKTASSRRPGSFFKSLPNPDEILISNNLDISEYEKLYLDDAVAAASQRFLSGVLAFDYEIKKGRAPDDIYNSVLAMVDEMPVKKYMSYILEAVAYGYSISEIVYELQNFGRFTPIELQQKPPKWFAFNEDHDLLFKSRKNPNGSTVPSHNFLVVKNKDTAENPYGEGNLKRCYWPVQIKKVLLKLYPVFIERYGMPIPVISYDSNQYSDTEAIDELTNGLFNLFHDGILVAPLDEVQVDLKAAFGSASDGRIFTQALEYFDNQISRIWLGHTGAMTSTPGKLGSEQAAITASEDIIRMGASLVEESFDTLIGYFNDLNYDYPSSLLPTFVLKRKGVIDKDKLDRDTVLTKEHGVRFKKSYYQNTYELDGDDFDIVDIATQAGTVFADEEDGQQVEVTEGSDSAAAGDIVEEQTSELINTLDTDKLTSKLVKMIEAAGTEAELLKLLESSAAFNAIDTTDLEDAIRNSYFSTSLLGNSSEETEDE